MIFELSRTFEALSTREDWQAYIPAIENLINAHLCGDHNFLPSRAVATNLLDLDCFSNRQNAVLRDGILAKFATLVSGAQSVKFTILLTKEGEADRGIRGNQRPMPLRSLQDSALCRQTCILVENSSRDGEFWKMMIRTFASAANFDEVPPLIFEMGGGSSLADAYRLKIERETPTICLADSDQDYPSGPLGETARRLQDLVGTEAVPTVQAYILPVREIENFVPVGVMRDVYADNPAVQVRIDKYSRIEDASRPPHCQAGQEYNRFVDLKLGLRRSVIRRHETNGGDFLRALWRVAIPHETQFELEGEEVIFEGIAINLVDKVVTLLNRPMYQRFMAARIKDLGLYPQIICIVRLILSFAAAPVRQRI